MSFDFDTLNVLHLDDDLLEIDQMKRAVLDEPREVRLNVESFRTKEQFVERLARKPLPDMVVLDINLGPAQEAAGISLIEHIRKAAPRATILMQSNLDKLKYVRDCLAKGADDFISKKTEPEALKLRMLLAHQAAISKRGINGFDQIPDTKVLDRMRGATVQKLAGRIPKIMNSAITAVHVYGESGTGKEVVADLFECFVAEGTPFVRVHCGAINQSLMESELFGHKKGAFTGATQDRIGLIEEANHGYVFLDEVATLTPATQVALLRVLEAKTIRPVGDTKTRPVSIKIISATNEDLRELVKQGRFREDLLQRLCELRIELPALRERSEEIPDLVEHFARHMDGGPYHVTSTTLEALTAGSWRNGNIRELRNCLRAMTEFAQDKVLTPLCIPAEIWKELDAAGEAEAEGHEKCGGFSESDDIQLKWKPEYTSYEDLTDSLLLDLIRRIDTKHGKSSMRFVGKVLGIPRSTLSDRLRSLVERKKIQYQDLDRMVNLGTDNTTARWHS